METPKRNITIEEAGLSIVCTEHNIRGICFVTDRLDVHVTFADDRDLLKMTSGYTDDEFGRELLGLVKCIADGIRGGVPPLKDDKIGMESEFVVNYRLFYAYNKEKTILLYDLSKEV